MSMILDALSRAEQERKESTEGVFDSTRYANSAAAKDDKVKQWILLALVINFCLLSLFAVIYFWKSDVSKDSLPEVSHTASVITPPVIESPEVQIANKPVKVAPIEKPVEKVIQPIEPKPTIQQQSSLQEEAVVQRERKISKAEAIGAIPTKKPKVTIATEPLSADLQQIPIPTPLIESNSNNQYLAISELSGAEKSQLSGYEINVHVYDNKIEERFVLVNMQKYKQGDRLPGGGPIISEITPEGLVMEYAQGKVLLERN